MGGLSLTPQQTLETVNKANPVVPLSQAKLLKHIQDASDNITGTRGKVNIARYAGWLMVAYTKAEVKKATLYERKKAILNQTQQAAVRAANDIGELPDVVNPERKERCRLHFQAFCEEYFQDVFYLKWSEDHLKAISKIEDAVLNRGLFALAMPRGSGKSVLCKIAVVWAALYAHAPFIGFIAASGEKAKDGLDGIKIWIETNPLLMEDFPEVCYPIRKLERIATRQRGQLYNGEHTRIEWGADKIVFPTIEGAITSGVAIFAAGMAGSEIRGQQMTLADGSVVRPSLVLVDDPQTTESAWSNSQCQRRLSVILGDILGMAGPSRKIAGLITCTVIRPGDLADMLLDREKNSEWKGERFKMLYAFPKSDKLWDEYNQIRISELRNDGNGERATAFYREHREEMDEGAVVGWEDRFNPDEISAVQHAMNLKFRDETSFFAEYQNEPLRMDVDYSCLTRDEIMDKINNTPRGVVPENCTTITGFVDVQKEALFWLVMAFDQRFTGYVIDYGVYPEQVKSHFTLKSLSQTLSKQFSGIGLEGRLFAGLEILIPSLLERKYSGVIRGSEMSISRLLIDANWGDSTDVIYKFCRQSPHSALLLPSHGKYVGASSIPFSEYKAKRGDQIGFHWYIPAMTGKRAIRHVLIDTNYWKTFIQARFATAMGDAGCYSLFGSEPVKHMLLAEHLSAEYYVTTEAKGRKVNEWKLKPGAPDNHWLDCVVGCSVGASISGVNLPAVTYAPSVGQNKQVKSFAELQKEARRS